jgi:hypothetical protein
LVSLGCLAWHPRENVSWRNMLTHDPFNFFVIRTIIRTLSEPF